MYSNLHVSRDVASNSPLLFNEVLKGGDIYYIYNKLSLSLFSPSDHLLKECTNIRYSLRVTRYIW